MKKMFLITFIIFLTLTLRTFSDETNYVGKIVSLHGEVEVKSGAAGGEWIPAEAGMGISKGDIIKTKSGSYAFLSLDGIEGPSTVQVEEHSQLLISEFMINKEEKTQNTLLDLAIGEILVKVKKMDSEKSTFQVKTPTTVIGAKGTAFTVKVDKLK